MPGRFPPPGSTRPWNGRAVANARQWLATQTTWPTPCARCGQPVTQDHWHLGHRLDRQAHPHLTWDTTNWQIEHPHCSTKAGARQGNRRRGRAATQQTKPAPTTTPTNSSPPRATQAVSFTGTGATPAPARASLSPVSLSTASLSTAGDVTGWPESGPPIPGLPPMPSGAVWPRLMTAPHPRAVGSYGPEFLAWTRERFGMHPKKTTSHRWWQQLVAHRALEHDEEGRLVWRTVVLSTARQVGKALDAATPILTGRGWITLADVVPGDAVFSPDGYPTVVEYATDLRPPADGAWRVTLTDGRSLVVDGEHLWGVADHNRGDAWRVMTTRQILDAGLARERVTSLDGRAYTTREYRWRLPRQSACVTPDVDLPLDPYILGYWLGDGTSIRPEITVDADDAGSLLSEMARAGYHIVSDRDSNGGPGTRMLWFNTSPGGGRRIGNAPDGGRQYSDSAMARLRGLGLLANKHIPAAFMASGSGQRLALMRGLMDSDGCVTATARGTRCELTLTCERLARDAYTLALSLGYRATIRSGRATFGGRDCGTKWRIGFSVGPDDPNPFNLPRKADAVVRTRWRKRPSIKSIEPVPDVSMRCIRVAAGDGMFLAGRGLVPTHNSWLLRELCLWRLSLADRLGEVQTVVHAAAKLSQAYGVWRPASRWARHNGYEVRLANGEQMIGAPDGSQWLIQAANDDLGVSQSVSLGLIDEAWRVRRDVFEQSLEPTGAEAADSQMFLVSTAGVPHSVDASDLMPVYRGHGLESMLAPRSLLMLEWSAPRGCDIDDPEMWRLASPHWTEERAELVADKRAKATTPQAVEAFGSQWLNQWRPVTVAATADVWLPAELVAACARDRVSPAPLVGALEVGTDQVSWAACVTDGDRVAVLPSASFEDALGWLLERRPPVVLAHQAVVNRLPQGGPWESRPMRTHEVAAAVSLLADRVRAGAVVWDHGPEVGRQFADTVLGATDGLVRVHAERSRGPVAAVKAISWAVWWAAQNPATDDAGCF